MLTAARALVREKGIDVSNDAAEIIQAFIDDALDVTRFTTDLGALSGNHMIFEAILENGGQWAAFGYVAAEAELARL